MICRWTARVTTLVGTCTSRSHRSEERRVGKERRSLCDWSSDVCSSDLGESLASIATWADTVKRVHFGPDVVVFDKDTQAFRRDLRNKNNRVWHFDDLPLDCPSYDACGDVYVPKP